MLIATNNRFERLPLGSISPTGWLKNQLLIQAKGLTGELEENWPDVGPSNGWLGGDGESWERAPYYLDGLVPLAYSLHDQTLIQKAQKWIEWTLNSQQKDGSFGPRKIETVNKDIDKQQDWWHYMIMLKVLMQYEEATNDSRVAPFIDKFLTYVNENIRRIPLKNWAKARGAELLLCVSWLYKRTKKQYLFDLAQVVVDQTINWTEILNNFPFWRKVDTWSLATHVVNVAMGVKMPGAIYEMQGNATLKAITLKGIESLMTYHGQAHGMFSGDEWLSGTHPSQGVELCAVVEYMYSLEELLRIFGDGSFGDILEKVAFNALPAPISRDWSSHQYDQQVNQVICNRAQRNWSNGPDANLFGLEPHFGCCTANMHQGWPKLCAHAWMSDSNGLIAVSYVPCMVKAKIGSDCDVSITVSGEYPFHEQVKIDIDLSTRKRFTISLRIPAWSSETTVLINGERTDFTIRYGFAELEREWSDGDTIEMRFQTTSKMVYRHMYACSIERGPLVFALPIKEDWRMLKERTRFHDWEVYPASQWQYGILKNSDIRVEHLDVQLQPFDSVNPPIKMTVRGKFVGQWKMQNNSADTPPMYPDARDESEVDITLVPYGCTRLRIGEFPVIEGDSRAL